MKEYIGKKIREARKAAGLTQAQLAEKGGVAAITIHQYEAGKRQPRVKQLADIAAALNISVDSLLTFENEVDAVIEAPTVDAVPVRHGRWLSKEYKFRWISVEERLPEPFENVLAANKRGKHYDIDKAWWNGRYFDRCAKGLYRNVTHWMPLPEPPGGDM